MSTASASAHGLATGHTAGPASARSAPARWPAVAGLSYLAAWVAGLAVWPSNLAVNATSGQVTAAYQGHQAVAAIQYLLVEGLAGLLLGTVLAAVLRATARGPRLAGVRPAAGLGALAVTISLVQCVLGLLLVAAAADASRAGLLFALVNRLDGVKMLALAGTAAWLVTRRGAPWRSTARSGAARSGAGRHDPGPADGGTRLPRWLQVIAGLAALALAGSAMAYLLLAGSLAGLVYLSGPLLLAWITGTGSWLTISRRRHPAYP
jgi:hypothetical protein